MNYIACQTGNVAFVFTFFCLFIHAQVQLAKGTSRIKGTLQEINTIINNFQSIRRHFPLRNIFIFCPPQTYTNKMIGTPKNIYEKNKCAELKLFKLRTP